ncbi:MAG: MFS transporter [Chitinophagaceae bacterium]|nr:MFS transporter [Chitinophagaceae bacterium]
MDNESARKTREVLRNREFGFFLSTRFILIFSLFMQNTVLGYWMYQLTNNPLSLGLIGLAEVIPAFGLAFIAGYFVDHRVKRNVYLSCIGFYVLNALLMLYLASSFGKELFSVQHLEWMIYLVMFFSGCIRAFLAPASFSLLPLLIRKDQIPQAITWSSTAWMLGSVTGPLVAGMIMAYAGIFETLLVAASFILISFFLIQFIRPQPPVLKTDIGLLEGLKQGFRFVFKTEIILAVLSLDLFAVLFGGAEALLPVFSKEILHIGEVGYGWLRSAHGIGSLFLFLILTYIPLKKNIGIKLLLCILMYGLSMLVFGLSEWFYLSFACLFFAGLFDGVSVVIRHSILQLNTPEELKGRVSSINMMFISSSNELGAFESGLTARYLGAVRSVVLGGMLTMSVVGFTYWKAKSLRNMDMPEK